MCIPCALRMHEECYEPVTLEATDESGTTTIEGKPPVYSRCCCYSEVSESSDSAGGMAITERVIKPREATKEPAEILDPISTGRKRAAQLKPIIEGMVCEWAKLKYAGGGVIPIVGCSGTVLTRDKGNKERTGNIHHGPDKSTLNNSDENLHRICPRCHNRWHTLNDPYYGERPPGGAPFVPNTTEPIRDHDKHTLATDEELMYSEAWWKLPTEVKAVTPFRKAD